MTVTRRGCTSTPRPSSASGATRCCSPRGKSRTQTEDAGFNRKRTIAHAIGTDGGERILRCIGGPSCIAKNRYQLPQELPLSWAAIMAAMFNQQPQGAN